jgi:hypothetical protein
MWEAFIGESDNGPVSTGGPLGGGKSFPKESTSEDEEDGDEDAEDVDGDPYEDEEGKQYDTKLVLAILNKVASGSVHPEEAARLIDQVVNNQERYGSEEDEEKNVKRHSAQKATDAMRSQFTKDKSAANVKRPQQRSVEGIKRDTTHYQQGM